MSKDRIRSVFSDLRKIAFLPYNLEKFFSVVNRKQTLIQKSFDMGFFNQNIENPLFLKPFSIEEFYEDLRRSEV